jgi:hypothetical protein
MALDFGHDESSITRRGLGKKYGRKQGKLTVRKLL